MLRSYSSIFGAPLMWCVTLTLLVPLHVQAADHDVERTIAFIQLQNGPDLDSRSQEYLAKIKQAFDDEKHVDFIHVASKEVLAKLGRNRAQLPKKLTEEARTALAAAKKVGVGYLYRADTLNAIKSLGAAEFKYRKSMSAPGADDELAKEYLDVLVQLATAHIIAKEKDKANEVFRSVITTFGPDAKVSSDLYRPDVVKAYMQVIKDVQSLEKGSIDVSSNPLGAKVFLGGDVKGRTPTVIGDLIPGNYTLRVERGSASSMLHRVRVDGGKTSKKKIDIEFENHVILDGEVPGLRYKNLSEAIARVPLDALTLGRLVHLNLVAAVGIFNGKLVVYLIDINRSRVINSNTNIAVTAASVSRKAIRRALAIIIGEQKTGQSGGEWFHSIPGWAATGAGVVSLGVGLAFSSALSAQTFYPCENVEKPCDPNQVPANMFPIYKQSADDRADQTKSDRTLAVIGLTAGVALVGVGGYLFYRHATGASNISNLDRTTDSHGRLASLPPTHFGSAPAYFPARR